MLLDGLVIGSRTALLLRLPAPLRRQGLGMPPWFFLAASGAEAGLVGCPDVRAEEPRSLSKSMTLTREELVKRCIF